MTQTPEPIASMPTGLSFERNLSAPFFDRARRRPRATALVFEQQALSYADLVAQVDAMTDLLDARGIAAGERVAYIGWNHPMLIVGLLAVARRGAVFVPVNPRSAPAECAHILNDCGARAIIAGTEFTGMLDELRPQLPVRNYLTFGEARTNWLAADFSRLHGDTPVSRHAAAGTGPDDTAVLLYTSGTTGRPKGVMLSHGNVWTASLNMLLLMQPTANSTLLGMAPMFHVAALALAIVSLAAGGRIVVLSTFQPDAVFDAIRQWNVTWTFGVPTMLQVLRAAPGFDETDLRGMLVLVAGSPVPVTLLEHWSKAGVRIVQGYGLTEATGTTTLLDVEFAHEKPGSAGLPFPLTEVQLRDVEAGAEIRKADTNGQVWIRGRNLTRGYWQLEDESRKAFDADGWFATGDIGRYDADGHLYIVDRLKDMIIAGGVNIYPAEVENVLLRHPNVAAAAVFGLPDAHWGEIVAAAIVSRDGEPVPADEIEQLCREALAGHKCPRRIEMIPQLPVNASGKVLKRALREQFRDPAPSAS